MSAISAARSWGTVSTTLAHPRAIPTLEDPSNMTLMSRILAPFALAVLLITTSAHTASAQFTAGRLAILEMPFTWNGTTFVIPTTGGQLVIREYATDGTPGIAVSIPATGPTMLVSPFRSGGASLTLSPAGDKLVFTGYTGTSDGSFNLTTSSATLVPRGIGTVDGQGNYTRPFTTSTFFSGGDIKAACTDGTNYWAGGSNSVVGAFVDPGGFDGAAFGEFVDDQYDELDLVLGVALVVEEVGEGRLGCGAVEADE